MLKTTNQKKRDGSTVKNLGQGKRARKSGFASRDWC